MGKCKNKFKLRMELAYIIRKSEYDMENRTYKSKLSVGL